MTTSPERLLFAFTAQGYFPLAEPLPLLSNCKVSKTLNRLIGECIDAQGINSIPHHYYSSVPPTFEQPLHPPSCLAHGTHTSTILFRVPSIHQRLFSDVQIVDEVMLEDINNILNAGDVPNLYAPEDLDAIMSACRWDGTLNYCDRIITLLTWRLTYSFAADVRSHSFVATSSTLCTLHNFQHLVALETLREVTGNRPY